MQDQSNLIERLKSLARQECWGDIIYDDDDDRSLFDLADGNQDDTFESGEQTGEVMLAREILTALKIDWLISN